MGDTIRIQMMNTFTIYINEIQADHMVNKSRKGVALMQYLILNREQPVPNQRLLAACGRKRRAPIPKTRSKRWSAACARCSTSFRPGWARPLWRIATLTTGSYCRACRWTFTKLRISLPRSLGTMAISPGTRSNTRG